MPFISRRSKLVLSDEEEKKLTTISKSRTESKSRVERSKILLYYSENKTISSIAKMLNTNRPKVERCVEKALNFGVMTALDDLPRKGKPRSITKEARAWLISIACMKPKELGLASEYWTTSELAKYIRNNCCEAGYTSLKKLSKGTVSKILSKSDIKPHKISYYTERRDPDFEKKMIQVLHVYKEVDIYKSLKENDHMVAILSYDEKPGIQVIENVAPDLNPAMGKYSEWKRDKEYKRHGTVSLLSSIDLLTGKIYGQVYERHRSKEFVQYLKFLSKIYPDDYKIKIVLDNHSSHVSKETKSYLKTVPYRFEFIFTPTHGSWLNIIETFFSKMTRSFLRNIRVDTVNELKERMKKYFEEINEMPVVFKWKYKMDEITITN